MKRNIVSKTYVFYFYLSYAPRYRSRADFDPNDWRLSQPRFSEKNFPKNVALADKLKAIADKYNSTPSQVTLAWILATSPNCKQPSDSVSSFSMSNLT